jgi:hypothetical protein
VLVVVEKVARFFFFSFSNFLFFAIFISLFCGEGGGDAIYFKNK